MKLIDKLLRNWRTSLALSCMPRDAQSVLDIGCDDGFLLKKLAPSVIRKEGIDPRLKSDMVGDGIALRKGFFPGDVREEQRHGQYDAIFALAVFEHFSEETIIRSGDLIRRLLSPQGRLIVTVPHPIVDHILDILMFLRLIDGQATEEHHGFHPNDLAWLLLPGLRLVERRKFQLGLNNLFVFEKQYNAADNINALS